MTWSCHISRIGSSSVFRVVRLDRSGIAHSTVFDVAAGIAWFVCDAAKQDPGRIPCFLHKATDEVGDRDVDCMACIALGCLS